MAFEELDQLRSVEELAARQGEIEQEMTRLNAEHAGKPFPEDVREQFASLKEEREEAASRILELQERQRIVSELAQRDKNVERISFQAKRPGATRTEDIYEMSTIPFGEAAIPELRERALRSIDTTQFPDPKGAENVTRLLESDATGEIARRILTTGSPVYKRAFGKYLVNKPRTPEEERALSSATNYAVPYAVDPTVVLTSDGVINPVRQIARVITITGNHWTGVASTGVTASYDAEAAEVSNDSPTLTQPAADVEKAQAFIKYPIEVGDDWGALQGEMARMFADAKDTLESSMFLTGLGHASNQPEGLLVGATGTVMTASASALAVGDLYALISALAPRWRSRAVFAGNLDIFQLIRQLDTSGGANLWVQLQFGEPGNLIGRRAYEWSEYATSVTGTVLSGSSSVLTFGDFNEFSIIDRVGMSVEVVPHIFATANNLPSGERGLYAYWRNTSDVRTAGAFKTLKVTA
jgi:HK97 family phage major capsid protein